MAAVVRSRIAVVLIVAHGIHAACAFKRDGELGAFLSNRSGTTENLFAASGNLDGFLAGLFVVIMAGAAAEIVRRRAYEFFYYVHQLFVVALYFSFAHSKWAFYLGIGPLALHAVDRAVRWWRSRQVRAIASCVCVCILLFTFRMFARLDSVLSTLL